MSKGKWGESFLKSGLPLEHLTLATFKSLNWLCSPSIEVERPNREGEKAWFEIDLEAHSSAENNDTSLSFLVECKYHDTSRFWFFLPHQPERWSFNDRVFNCIPVQTLVEPRHDDSALALVKASTGGIVVSEDGTKQDNAIRTAIQQLANAFVPSCLSEIDFLLTDLEPEDDEEDEYYPVVVAKIPMIVTNATLFRLKEEVTNLEEIRNASTPNQVADEIPWTWHYFDPPMSLLKQNHDAIQNYISTQAEFVYRFPHVKQRIWELSERPNWIAIVNINHLSTVISEISQVFMSLPTLSVEKAMSRKKRSAN